MLQIQRVKYIIWAADMNRALDFYENALGAKITKRSDVISEIDIAGSVIGVHGGGEGKRTWTGMSFQIDDVVKGAEIVQDAGGRLTRPIESDSDDEPPHLAMVMDTESNEFMLTRPRG